MIVEYRDEDHEIDLLYITEEPDIVTSEHLCFTKSVDNAMILILPHVKTPGGFFVMTVDDRVRLKKWL